MTDKLSDYFRSVLVIDDVVELQGEELQPIEPITDLVDADPEAGLVAPDDEAIDDMPVFADEIERAFLQAGLLCAVHRVKDEELSSDWLLSVISNTDLLVVDWLLEGDPDATLGLIRHLIAESGSLRIVTVFTGSPNLDLVSDRIVQETSLERVEQSTPFVLRHGSTFVSIFGKPGPRRIGPQSNRQVRYEEIPERIHEDIAPIIDGILPAVAFAGIRAVRESIPGLLGRFTRDLDAGLLLHRMLLPEVEDAADHVTEALGDSFLAALQGSDIGTILTPTSLRSRLKGVNLRVESKADGWTADPEEIETHVIDGLSSRGLKINPTNLKAAQNVFDAGVAAHDRFGHLLSISAVPATHLSLGSIVWDGTDYLLCVQPPCDSVRLSTDAASRPRFPFVELEADIKGEKHIVVPHATETDSYVRLGFRQGLGTLRLYEFDIEEPAGRVIPQSTGDGILTFTTKDNIELREIATLRSEFARTAVERLISTMVRSGSSPSEFIRVVTR